MTLKNIIRQFINITSIYYMTCFNLIEGIDDSAHTIFVIDIKSDMLMALSSKNYVGIANFRTKF